MKKLEVLLDGRWQYVFCQQMPDDKVMPTANRWKALPAFHLEWFQNHFADHQFRASCNSETQDIARRARETAESRPSSVTHSAPSGAVFASTNSAAPFLARGRG